MKSVKFMLALALAVSTAMGLTACTDEQIAFGAGAVVGVIISDGGHHHHHRRPPRYHRGRRPYANVNLAALSSVERVSVKYNLSPAQAEIFTSHILPAQKGDLRGFAALGFEKQDLVALYNGQNPSASTLTTLSQKLNIDLEEAHQLIQDIKIDAQTAQETMM